MPIFLLSKSEVNTENPQCRPFEQLQPFLNDLANAIAGVSHQILEKNVGRDTDLQMGLSLPQLQPLEPQ